MYIKKADSMFLINFNHFDGIEAETYDNNIYQLNLFKMNAKHSFRRLEKCIHPMGKYNMEQTKSILAGIEKNIEDHKMIYSLPKSEVENA